MTPLLEEYFRLLEFHRRDFQDGDLLLLMQVGSFYEAYEIDEPVSQGCAKLISHVLRMHLTRKNGKQSSSERNPWMVGFPTYVLGKHLTKLNEEGYRVAVYDQKEDHKQERVLKGIYNYTLRYEHEEESLHQPLTNEEPRVFSVQLEKYKTTMHKKIEYRFLVSVVIIEMNSGKVHVYENDTEEYQRDVQHILCNYNPREVLLCTKGFETDEEEYRSLFDSVQLTRLSEDTMTTEIKHSFLEKIYELNDFSMLGIERHQTIIDLLSMTLEYIQKHDPLLITKLQYPVFLEGYTKYMNYNRDAFLELNIMSICERRRSYVQTKKQKTLFDLLSQPMTHLGKRYLESILRRPLLESTIIQERWDLIEYFMNQLDSLRLQVSFPDLEWYFLKWKRGKLSRKQVGHFWSSIKHVYETYHSSLSEFFKDLSLDMILADVESIWNVEEMMNDTFLKQPVHEMIEYEQKIKSVQSTLSEIELRVSSHSFKLQSNGDHEYYLTTTPKKWDAYQFEHKHLKCPFYELSKTKTLVKLSFEELDQSSNQYKHLQLEKSHYVRLAFESTSRMILEKYEKRLERVIEKISMLDCYYHLAVYFKKHHYCRPSMIEPTEENGHSFHVETLRHPIYEIIEQDKIFVPYSIHTSSFVKDANVPLGYLIYGMNSSGKSTLLKSIGCALWMSQCGLYVPAQSFSHTLIDGLYSKIGVYDNLFLGHSTFVAEMSELQYILKKATRRSFLLCDELTSGTETKSATGIVTSSLFYFLNHKIPFMVTTHLHFLSRIREIANESKIKICHFEVSTNSSDSMKSSSLLSTDISIHYDRQLKEGSGNDTYGIEIAKAVGLPSEFISTAYEYRNKIDIYIHSDVSSMKASRYNKKLIMDQCYRCQSRIQLQTHHITPQESFHESSIHPMNGLYNLVVLCQSCHSSIHHPLKK